jgi:hypothetical protein
MEVGGWKLGVFEVDKFKLHNLNSYHPASGFHPNFPTFVKNSKHVLKSCAVRYGWRYCRYRTFAQKSIFQNF